MDFSLRKHPTVRNGNGAGFYGLKMLRKPDGRRIIFESVNGFRIFEHSQVSDTSIMIRQQSTGFEFRGNRRVVQTADFTLSDLALVNVYDNSAEFYSRSSIDFAYVAKTADSEIEMLTEFVVGLKGIVRAQWTSQNDEVDRIISELSIGRKVIEVAQRKRMIDMDTD